jgi:hypothetical protein
VIASSAAINATLYDNLNFNFIRDMAPVAGVFRGPYVMVVNPSVPTTTVRELIAYAKARRNNHLPTFHNVPFGGRRQRTRYSDFAMSDLSPLSGANRTSSSTAVGRKQQRVASSPVSSSPRSLSASAPSPSLSACP